MQIDKRLHDAVISKDMMEIISLAVDYPYLTSTVDENGRLPIHLAAYGGDVEATMYLLTLFPESNDRKDLDGHTPLDWALEMSHPKLYNKMYLFTKREKM